MSEEKSPTEAFFSRLSAFEGLTNHSLQAVRKIHEEGCFTKLILGFGSVTFVVTAEQDDSVAYEIFSTAGDPASLGGVDVSSEEPWRHFLGKNFSWGWVTVNQQGYSDGVMLSFEEIVFPEVVVNVIASSLEVGRVSRVL